jgi:hypothetical protein
MRLKTCFFFLSLGAAGLMLGQGCGKAAGSSQFPGFYQMLFIRSGQLLRINSEGVEFQVSVENHSGTFASPSFYNLEQGNKFCFILKEGDSSFLYKSDLEVRARLRVPGFTSIAACRWRPDSVNEIAVAASAEGIRYRVLRISANNGAVLDTVTPELSSVPDLRWSHDGAMLFIMQRNLVAGTGGPAYIYRLSNGLSTARLYNQTCGVLALTDIMNGAVITSQVCDTSLVLFYQSFSTTQSDVFLPGSQIVNGFAYDGGTLFYSDGQNLTRVAPARVEAFASGFSELIPYPCKEVFAVSPDDQWVFYLSTEGNLVRYKINDNPNERMSLQFPLNAPGINSNQVDISVWMD